VKEAGPAGLPVWGKAPPLSEWFGPGSLGYEALPRPAAEPLGKKDKKTRRLGQGG